MPGNCNIFCFMCLCNEDYDRKKAQYYDNGETRLIILQGEKEIDHESGSLPIKKRD